MRWGLPVIIVDEQHARARNAAMEDGNRCAWPDDSSRLVATIGAALIPCSVIFGAPRCEISVLHQSYSRWRDTRSLGARNICARRKTITYLFTNFSQRALYHTHAPRYGGKRRERVGRKEEAYEFEATRERHAAKFTFRTCSTANTPATNPTDRRRSYASYLSQVRLT